MIATTKVMKGKKGKRYVSVTKYFENFNIFHKKGVLTQNHFFLRKVKARRVQGKSLDNLGTVICLDILKLEHDFLTGSTFALY